MTYIPHEGGKTDLEENPGRFVEGVWFDVTQSYKSQSGHYEDDGTFVDDPRFKRFVLVGSLNTPGLVTST